jgi:putative hemolysin
LDVALLVELVLFIILLGFSAFFSSTETSLFSLNKVQIEKMRADGNRRVDLIERILSEPRRLIVTILIGNEFVNVTASVISASMIIHLFGAENKFINLFVMVPLLLIFGEITPKVLAIRNNVAFATFESGLIDQFARLITPLRWVIRTVSEFFTTLLIGKERSRGNLVTEDMVRTLAHVAVGEGTLDHAEAQYIDQIFDFGNLRVNNLMTARADVTFVPVEASGTEILGIFRESRQSRMPVYDDNRDNIVGILHARDLLAVNLDAVGKDRKTLEALLRPPYFVPESRSAAALFDTFRSRKRSFALVVDEYGGVTGVITMSDLLGAIFGDIPTPSDEADDDWVHELTGNRFALPGSMTLDDFNSRFKANLAVDDIRTLGGLVLHHCGELPVENASVEAWPFRFTVQRIEANRITEVLVEMLPGTLPSRLEARGEPGVVAEGGEDLAPQDPARP